MPVQLVSIRVSRLHSFLLLDEICLMESELLTLLIHFEGNFRADKASVCHI